MRRCRRPKGNNRHGTSQINQRECARPSRRRRRFATSFERRRADDGGVDGPLTATKRRPCRRRPSEARGPGWLGGGRSRSCFGGPRLDEPSKDGTIAPLTEGPTIGSGPGGLRPDRTGRSTCDRQDSSLSVDADALLRCSHSGGLDETAAVGVTRPQVAVNRSLEIANGAPHSGVAYASPGFWAGEAEPCNRRPGGLARRPPHRRGAVACRPEQQRERSAARASSREASARPCRPGARGLVARRAPSSPASYACRRTKPAFHAGRFEALGGRQPLPTRRGHRLVVTMAGCWRAPFLGRRAEGPRWPPSPCRRRRASRRRSSPART